MTEDEALKLPPPPKTLTREQVLRKLSGVGPETVHVEGWGEVKIRPLTVRNADWVARRASAGENGGVEKSVEVWTLIYACPDLFTEDDYELLMDAPIGTLAPLMFAVGKAMGVDGNGGGENVPLTFRGAEADRSSAPVRRRKRARDDGE